jgi:hypothetical protein
LKRKLLLLNLVLLAAAAVIGARVRESWRAASERQDALLRQSAAPLPPPPYAPLPEADRVQPVTYADIADKMLFSKDRNPVVIVEKPAPPPPKPMPSLPVLYGVMDIDGPTALLAEKAGAPSHEFRPGQAIGEFKLVAVNNQQIVFEWEGKRVERKVDELVYRHAAAGAESARAESAGSAAQQAKAAAAPPPPPPSGRAEPGVDVGGGIRACQPGDSSPPGTVSGGMRKVVTASPFGQVCRWEPVPR